MSIVNWNTRDQLCRCLTALRAALRHISSEIIVVDNASSDGSVDMVRREFPEVKLFALQKNLGFAGGNNVAFKSTGAENVLILNPDVEVVGGAVEKMLAFLEEHADAAAVSPLLIGRDGTPHHHLYRRFPTVAQIALFWTSLGLISKRVAVLRRRVSEHVPSGANELSVDQLPGAALMLRSSVLQEVGSWDADFFIWFEDVDWCFRVKQAGYRLYLLPSVTALHEGGASFQAWSMQKRVFQFYRAFFRFLCKHRLERLTRFALPVISADLYVREVGLRAVKLLTRRETASVRTLRPTREAIQHVVERHRAGELVAFVDAGEGYQKVPSDPKQAMT